jgi:hypothetical protein
VKSDWEVQGENENLKRGIWVDQGQEGRSMSFSEVMESILWWEGESRGRQAVIQFFLKP